MSAWHAAYDWLGLIIFGYLGIMDLVYAAVFLTGLFSLLLSKKKTAGIKEEAFDKPLPEICLILPVYNEQAYILSVIECLLNLSYPNKKIVIVNDGSKDETWNLIQEKLQLEQISQDFKKDLPSKPIRGVYRSCLHPECLVVDKENGSRFDALNAALNFCQSPYFLTIDADTFIEDDSVFLLDRMISSIPDTIAIGAVVRIRDIDKIAGESFSLKFLPMIQSVEYLRTFLMRLGWEKTGGIMALSGAFSCFHTQTMMDAGGFAPTFAHDLEIVLRLHRQMLEKDLPYRMLYIPDPIAWTYALTSLKALKYQRIQWHKGLLESMWLHKKMFLNRSYGAFGLFVYPFLFFGEVLAPLVELMGYFYFLTGWMVGIGSLTSLAIFLALTLGFSVAMSWISLGVDELAFKKKASMKETVYLFGFSILENFGFRQLTLIWKGMGLMGFLNATDAKQAKKTRRY